MLVVSKSNAQKCNCNAIIKEIISITEDSYSGYSDRIKVSQIKYQKLKEGLLKKQNKGIFDFNCFNQVKSYIKFFNDEHFSLSFKAKIFPDKVRSLFSVNFPTVKNKVNGLDIYPNIEGDWYDDAKRYSIRIISLSKNKLVGYIIKGDSLFWYNSQIKLEILKGKKDWEAKYFLRDHTPIESKLIIEKDFLRIGDYVRYKRVGSIDTLDKTDFLFARLNEKFNYYKISNFALENAKKIDSIIEANRENIKNTDNLIIDLRNNSGGSKAGFLKILQFLGKDSFAKYGTSYKASQRNIDSIISYSKDTMLPQKFREGFSRMGSKMQKNKNQLIELSPKGFDYIDTTLDYPKKIYVLANGKTASAAEMLVNYAQQSSKVTILGTPTIGVQHYSNINQINLESCNFLMLNVPMSRSSIIDEMKTTKSKIKPTVNIKLPDSEWVNFVIKNYENN